MSSKKGFLFSLNQTFFTFNGSQWQNDNLSQLPHFYDDKNTQKDSYHH